MINDDALYFALHYLLLHIPGDDANCSGVAIVLNKSLTAFAACSFCFASVLNALRETSGFWPKNAVISVEKGLFSAWAALSQCFQMLLSFNIANCVGYKFRTADAPSNNLEDLALCEP